MDGYVDNVGEVILMGVLVMSGVIWPKSDFFFFKSGQNRDRNDNNRVEIVGQMETELLVWALGATF